MKEALEKLCQELVLELAIGKRELSSEEQEKLIAYLKLIQDWNVKVDLVSPAPCEVLIERHLIDSLAAYLLITEHYDLGEKSSLIDIGSGAGLPGVVFSIMQPKRKVYLCEPRDKRCHFLKEVRRELALDKLEVISARMEDLEGKGLAQVGLTISRAIPQSSPFLSLSKKILSPGGLAVQMLGPSFKTDSKELKIHEYRLPQSKTPRKLVVYQKCFT